jgi:hypothetical protein
LTKKVKLKEKTRGLAFCEKQAAGPFVSGIETPQSLFQPSNNRGAV